MKFNLKSIISILKLKNRYLMYAIELLSEIASHEHHDIKWLHSVNKYEKFDQSTDAIIELLNVFEDIVHTNAIPDLKAENINRIISQLVNIIRISSSLDKKAIANIQYHISLLKNEVLNPSHISSPGFSQEGEDLILKRLFPSDKKGFFIDVGAHHPTRFSNTYLLYKMGWRGINIDPRPNIMDLFDTYRPEDINLEAAVGDGNPEHKDAFYISFQEPAYNSVFYENKEDVKNIISSDVIDIKPIQVKSLDNILEEHLSTNTDINLLSIDVEGLELQVLKGFSIERYQPDVIVLEVRGFDINSREKSEEYNLIVNSGYKLRSVLYHSLIFQKIDSNSQ